MSSFSPSDAGLEGFRVTRENPKAFTRWVLFSFAISVIGAVVTVSMPPEVRNALATLRADETPDARELGEALLAAAPLVIAGLMVQCVMAAAVYRIIFRHDDDRFGYLRLGMDELRLMALTVQFVLILMGLLGGVTILSGFAMAAASAAGDEVGTSVGLVLEFVSVSVVLYVVVRLSLAPVVTFAERRMVLFGSWSVTRGHVLHLLLAYLLAICCMFVITLLTLVLFLTMSAIFLTVTRGDVSTLTSVLNPDETSFAAYFNPLMLVYMFIASIITALWYAVIAAPGAWAYLQLSES
jgi:hypothetical protein